MQPFLPNWGEVKTWQVEDNVNEQRSLARYGGFKAVSHGANSAFVEASNVLHALGHN